MTSAALPHSAHSIVFSLKTLLTNLGVSLLLLIILIIASAFGLVFYYVVVLLLVLLMLPRRRYFQAFICVFGLPVLSFALTLSSYCYGSAKLEYVGLPHMEFYNIDPVYRCGNETGGCLAEDTEWITLHNLILEAIISIFGPERGSYTGPYPTETDAINALASAVPVDLAALTTDHFDVDKVHVRLDDGVGKKMFTHWFGVLTIADIKQGPFAAEFGVVAVTAAIWQNRVLLLRGPDFHSTIIAFDLKVGRPFAYYRVNHGRYPPVMWRKADDLQ